MTECTYQHGIDDTRYIRPPNIKAATTCDLFQRSPNHGPTNGL